MCDLPEKDIHNLIYWSVCQSCYDREYIYRAFVKHFTEISRQMFIELPIPEKGEYHFKGIKSNKDVKISWIFERRLNFCGSNYVTVCAYIKDRIMGSEETLNGTFNVNTGRNIDLEDFI